MNNQTNKVLFPISVDSKRFGTIETLNALNSISQEYSDIVFLIADGLQLYNKASNADEGNSLNTILNNFKLKNDYSKEREKWLSELKGKVSNNISNSNWEIKNIFSISDNIFHNIYRNIFISYLAIEEFRNDITVSAKKHRENISTNYSDYDLELSIAYVLEEIAINLRLRVVDKIKAEYYLGNTLTPLTNLYKGVYNIDVFTLCGVDKFEMDFEFYHSPDTDKFSEWVSAIS